MVKVQVNSQGKILTLNGSALLANEGGNNFIGQVINSTLPITSDKLHLLDGSILTDSTFVNYMENAYNTGVDDVINATITGTLTENNFTLSGFGLYNYASTPSALSLYGNTWEMVYKIHTSSYFSSSQVLTSDSTYRDYQNWIGLESDGHFKLVFSTNRSWYDIDVSGTYTVQPDTDYWVKIIFTGTQYKLEYSTDGTNYTTDITVSSDYNFNNAVWLIGRAPHDSYAYPWEGSIDFEESYININGNLAWKGVRMSYFVTENEWQAEVTDKGMCEKFVIDTVNHTCRIPKLTSYVYANSYSQSIKLFWYLVVKE